MISHSQRCLVRPPPQAYTKDPNAPIGRVVLNSYFCSKSEDAATSFEFTINA